jgi:cardiolipin synthase
MGGFWGGMLLALVIVQILVIWSIRRHHDPSLKIECNSPIDKLMPSLAGLTLGTPIAGNKVEVHENGAFFDVLIERIRGAQRSVHFETFLWEDGQLGRRLADALTDRARAGLKVRVLLDAQGSKKVGKEVVQQMCEAGCKVTFFHKKAALRRRQRRAARADRPQPAGRLQRELGRRDRRPVPGRRRLSAARAGRRRADACGVREAGEFSAGGEDPAPHGHLPRAQAHLDPEPVLHPRARCHRSPRRRRQARRRRARADAFDQRLGQPDGAARGASQLREAAEVRLFEYPHTLLHQKIMTVDGVWSAIGSSNFDDRSFETNDEISLSIADEALTAKLDAIFEKYVPRAQEVELEKWKRRGWWHKTKDNAFYLLNELL